MFLYRSEEGIPDHPFDSNIRREVFVTVLLEQGTIDLNTNKINGSASLSLTVYHKAKNSGHRHSGLDRTISLLVENKLEITLQNGEVMGDFDFICFALTNRIIHIRDLILQMIKLRMDVPEDGGLSVVDQKMMY